MSQKVVAVRFREAGKVYHFSPNDLKLHIGDPVILETDTGVDFGYVAEEILDVPEDMIQEPMQKVLRLADEQDLEKYKERRLLEKRAYKIGREKIERHKLEMNLVEVESLFEGDKLVFYFTAESRIDFRELVKDLATMFRTRIELRQIGVRDQARMVGGFGLCGRELCCCSFLSDFAPVSIKMAKVQGLSMNPGKISGSCGRLMCCLKYEQEAYEDAHSRLPEQGDTVSTPEGKGIIQSVDYLKETARVFLERDDVNDIVVVPCEDIEVILSKKKKRQQAASCGGCPKKQSSPKRKNNNTKKYSSGTAFEQNYEIVSGYAYKKEKPNEKELS